MSAILTLIIQFVFIKLIYSQDVDKQPNFVFIFADDLGFNDVGWRGASNIYTPNLDGLRNNNALELARFYVTPKCSPTRSSFMTGRYAHLIGMQHGVGILEHFTCGLDPSVSNVYWGERLKTCGGYKNYYLGKWHLGEYKYAYTPIFRGGLDYFKGYLNSQVDYFNFTYEPSSMDNVSVYDWREDTDIYYPPEGDGENYTTIAFGEGALAIIEEIGETDDETPFSLIVSFEAPHTPLHEAPGRFWDDITGSGNSGPDGQPFGSTSNDNYEDRVQFISMVWVMDYYIGEIIDTLKATTVNNESIWDNTWLFFFSDNGGTISAASNYPLRGAKSTNFEGGVRVPALISGGLLANNKKGKVFDGIVHITDLYSTVIDYSNVSDAGLRTVGYSLRTLLEGPGMESEMVHDRDAMVIGADSYQCSAENIYKLTKDAEDVLCGAVIRDFSKDDNNATTGIWKLAIGSEFLTGTQGKFGWGELDNQDKVIEWANASGLEQQIICDPLGKGYTRPVWNDIKSTDCGNNLKPCLYRLDEDPCETDNKAENSTYDAYLVKLWTDLEKAYEEQVNPYWARSQCEDDDINQAEIIFDYLQNDVGHFEPFAEFWIEYTTGVDDKSLNKSNTPIYGGLCEPTPAPTSDPTSDPTTEPTMDPTTEPTMVPTNEPTNEPTTDPTNEPTIYESTTTDQSDEATTDDILITMESTEYKEDVLSTEVTVADDTTRKGIIISVLFSIFFYLF